MSILALMLVATLAADRAPAPSDDGRALRCAATNAVLAAMLTSAPDATDADRTSAAMFEARARAWRSRIGRIASDVAGDATSDHGRSGGVDGAVAALAQQVAASASPAAAQALLEARLGECAGPDDLGQA
ncbi:hypothetical protein [Novosphingobium huizhouense]|uniref:hypothetical protein n=1 Tax=Novosphingobium huizhouense TaxID=2866625 RepID=UPI001CD8C0FE|nr:hypothetical protein [Novosphingobium huizhouense]